MGSAAQDIVFVPGLLCTGDLFAAQIAHFGKNHRCFIADHTTADTLEGIARSILDSAPQQFALAGLSMGGYIAFEIMRQAPARVAKLALINTQARPDTAEATTRRQGLIARASNGEYRAVLDEMFPGLVHPSRQGDVVLRQLARDMGDDVGPEAFIRQQTAVIGRPDSRPTLAWIKCPTLVLTGDQDNTIPNALSMEMASGIPGAKLVVLPNCGHLPQVEQTQATTDALTEWLRS